MNDIELTNILFEAKDIFGKNIRTTKDYWNKIFLIKHKELKVSQSEVIKLLQNPDEVRKSVQDPFIYLFYKNLDKKYLVVVVKYLNNHGFVVTIYKTSKLKRKGEKIWPK
ncbi:hypothetical protein B6D29_01045 [Microgenomates bacterium UTCPR1]|nr:MAG: hypothetical protein B6D29_01045 [Microgenomates bacterium UTCPR1]